MTQQPSEIVEVDDRPVTLITLVAKIPKRDCYIQVYQNGDDIHYKIEVPSEAYSGEDKERVIDELLSAADAALREVFGTFGGWKPPEWDTLLQEMEESAKRLNPAGYAAAQEHYARAARLLAKRTAKTYGAAQIERTTPYVFIQWPGIAKHALYTTRPSLWTESFAEAMERRILEIKW